MSRHAPAVGFFVGATACWAGNYVFGKVAVASMTPLSIVWLRWVIALIQLFVTAQVVEHPDWRNMIMHHWRFLLIQSALGLFACNVLLYEALRVSTAFSASLINAANPGVDRTRGHAGAP